MQSLSDPFGREFRYLRLSLTELCNFRCKYCLPNGNIVVDKKKYLNLNEIENLLSAFVELGLEKVRLTGGEPGIRKDFIEIISLLNNFNGIKSRVCTTNGYNLVKNARKWHNAGLTGINISIDSLKRERFADLTGHNLLDQVLAGLSEALAAGFDAVKINSVLLRGFELDEFELFLKLIENKKITVRFIELMQTNTNQQFFKDNHLSPTILEAYLLKNGWKLNDKRTKLSGPAKEYTNEDYKGRVGFISPYSKGFCDTCNRLRVSATGDLHLCLFGNAVYSLRQLLQTSEQKEELKNCIVNNLKFKRQSHFLLEGDFGVVNNLATIGG